MTKPELRTRYSLLGYQAEREASATIQKSKSA
jgi:hypothetical protein